MLTLDECLFLARKRAEYGAMFLDIRPITHGWATRIKKPIKMASTHDCILAQLFGRFRDGADALLLDEQKTVNLGFRGTNAELRSMQDFAKYYKVLSECWEHERKIRLPA